MVDIVKPDISSVWAEAGAIIAPSNEKIKMGWTSEVPPHQYENFVQNRQDEMLAYLNQKGVPEWRIDTEYFLGKSFVQDAGKIYKANKNSGGLLPNQKPSTDATNEYWEQATFSLSDLKQAVGASTKDVMSQKATSDAIALKVDSTRVKQTTGVSTTDIMSQKAVTDALGTILPTPVVQSSGSSTTDVMSQKAVTDALLDWVSDDPRAKTALNATGEAPIYACRAWVNFNGTGTVAIRASGNVSSITDNGTGDYTVNFTTAMPDANYCVNTTTSGIDGSHRIWSAILQGTLAESSVRVLVLAGDSSRNDRPDLLVSVFR